MAEESVPAVPGKTRIETPDTVHGRLLEAVHISGYTFERAFAELEWLLDEDRWQRIGGGFDDINKFLATIDLSEFKIAVEQRKKLANRLKDIEASQRATAKMLGVSNETVRRDLGVTCVTPASEIAAETKGQAARDITNVTPEPSAWFQADADPADATKREHEKVQRRESNAAKRASIGLAQVELPSDIYRCIVIDPPWPMEKIERDVAPNQVGFEYPTMSEEELLAFDVARFAHDDCHLFLWTTHKFLPMAFRLLEAWGFKYVCAFVWHKPGGFQPFGLPQYNCEFALYARRGTPSFLETKALFCCFDAKRREHSRKPNEFYDVVRRVTAEPRIDVFSRERRDGFAQFGNEAEKFEGAA